MRRTFPGRNNGLLILRVESAGELLLKNQLLMAAPRQFPLRLVLLLALVPLVFLTADYFGAFGRPNNMALDWMFKFRGEIPAVDITKPGNPPLKVVYVDVDANTVQHLGASPWSRRYYAGVIEAVCKDGGAKAVGLDFILSPAGMKSPLVDKALVKKDNEAMGEAMEIYHQAVIGTVYSSIEEDDTTSNTTAAPAPADALAAMAATAATATSTAPAATDKASAASTTATAATTAPATAPAVKTHLAQFPYIYKHFTDPTKNDYPESPTYPVINTDRIRTGMLDVATEYNGGGLADNTPRWVPLFAETTGPQHSNNLVKGFMDYANVTDDFRDDSDPDKIVVLNPNGGIPFEVPKIQHMVFYNLSVKLALAYLGLDESNIVRTDDAIKISDKSGKLLLDIPLREKQLIEVNWFSKWSNQSLNPHISFWDVVTAESDLMLGNEKEKGIAKKFFANFQDAIVLIGPTDPILQDIAPTPFDAQPVAKVSVYGNLLKTFFSGKFIRHVSGWQAVIILLGLTILVGGLSVYSGAHSGWAKIAAALILIVYVMGVFEAFTHFTLVLPLMAPVGCALMTTFVGGVIRLIDEEKQKKRIKGMFGTYLSPDLVHRMVESGEEPKLGGEQTTITIFFSDVQGFSGFSEVLTPQKLVELMNEYLTAMTDILQAESGTLDKYIGDAVVAMYGAPITLKDNALRACVSACRMQKRLADLRKEWSGQGDKWPPIVHRMRTRIGLNTGQAVVGNMGSTSRFNYTMMGDDVNLGARLESGAKQFGVYTMCAESTVLAAEQDAKTILFRRLNKIVVKGRSAPVTIYEVVCFREDATPDTLKCVELFEKGLECYFAQKWDEAIALFVEAEKLEPNQPGRDAGVDHNPSEIMQKNTKFMKENPPAADWDGVLHMKEK
jgi:adenylate cyclase